jgi:16S rRNA (guanine(966)-N(2))-methyltransferase RsmD
MNRNRLRIIGGIWRSRTIRIAPRAELRPTPDRVRETLFNWLGQELTGKDCLDLFAGSGALGFEAASRGARRVVMVERDAPAFRMLQANRSELGATQVELARVDALEFLRGNDAQYDIVFLDPPFRSDSWERVLSLLGPRLKNGALVYCESGGARAPAPGWKTWRSARAGQVTYQLLKRIEDETESGLSGDVRSDNAGS